MGLSHAILTEDGPTNDPVETWVCAQCVQDEFLIKIVNDNVEQCDYCGKESEVPIAAEFALVFECVFRAISNYYADAQYVGTPWDEGEWAVPQVEPDTIVSFVNPGWNDDLYNDVLESLDPWAYWIRAADSQWTGVNLSNILSSGWLWCREYIVKKTRFFFVEVLKEEAVHATSPYDMPPHDIFNALGNLCIECELIEQVPVEQEFFRVRVSKNFHEYSEFEQLGVPPYKVTNAGRMNPPGIPYFYLAYDEQTARKEVLSRNVGYCVGKFRNIKALRVLNFNKLPNLPSIFDPDKFDLREKLVFLHDVKKDIIQPVSKDGMEHVEYVPTQVLSEYFRYLFKDEDGRRIDGFVYPSVKHEVGINIVIFDSSNDSLQTKFELVSSESCFSDREE